MVNEFVSHVFGTDGTRQDQGSTTIDGFTIVWTSTGTNNDADGTTVKITNAAGEVVYEYIMPFQEKEGWAWGDQEG